MALPSEPGDVVRDLYESHGQLFVGLAMRLGLTDEDAADVVQEAHLRLWHELRRGETIRDPGAWASQVVYRLAMDHHRIRRRVRETVARLVMRSTPEPVSGVDVESVWQAVDRLPRRERVALYLRYRADLDYERIGAVMTISSGAARMYVSRGLARLRATLGPEE